MLLLCSLLPALAADDADLVKVIADYNAHAVHRLPTLDAQQRAELLAGEAVRVLDKNDDPDLPSAAVGLIVTDRDRDALWIAAQDPHTQLDSDLTEAVIEPLGPDSAIWYGYMDLPRPVRDRQWVISSANNHRLATATDGRCWEHLWKNVDDGLDRARPMVEAGEVGDITIEQLEHAIVTPVNHGSWTLCTLPGSEVLLSYQATSVVGGAIPDWLVVQLVMGRLEGALRTLETRATEWAPTHYAGAHAPVPGGDGVPLTHLD